jgi:hypothetical protein
VNLQWKRIVVWIGLFVAGIALGLLWSVRSIPHRPVQPSFTPWIGLPDTGMDASSQPAREALIEAAARAEDGSPSYGNDPSSLARTCSFDSLDGINETYVALMGRSFLAPDQKALRVKFVVRGDEIDVAIQDDADVATYHVQPAVLPPPQLFFKAFDMPIPRRIRLTKSSLKPVADAWRDRYVWQTEQGPLVECTDAPTVILEACVHGRYAVRDRTCDAQASWKVNDLRNAFRQLLPPADNVASPTNGK